MVTGSKPFGMSVSIYRATLPYLPTDMHVKEAACEIKKKSVNTT
jgi:hypothetical protein